MGALGHYLEREGVPTAQVSLIREQTAAIRPPRALWVPFMLGRPFGAPNDRAFQRRVLLALLRLFEAPRGPVLEDFPDDAPADPADRAGAACPVNFAPASARAKDLPDHLLDEVRQLAVWYDLARKRRGRTTVGISGLPIEDAARIVARFIGGTLDANPRSDASLGMTLKRCCDDLKAYAFEALGAQPGNLSATAIDAWFWHHSAIAKAFLAVRQAGMAHPDKSVAAFAERSLVPRAVLHRFDMRQ